VPPGIANYTPPPLPDYASWPFEKRLEEAKKLLAEAGYGPNKPLKFEFRHRGYDQTGMFAAMQADWAKIGVQVELIGTETQIAYESMRARNFQLGDVAWVADYNDAMNFLYLQRSDTGSQNYSDYNNPKFDGLLDQADREPDLAKRAALLQEAEKLMMDEAVVMPIWLYINSNLVSPRVTGFVDNITDTHRTRHMCFKK